MLNTKTERISISLPGWLIDVLDKVCGMKDFSRSCFIKRAIRHYILHQLDSLTLWDEVYRRLVERS